MHSIIDSWMESYLTPSVTVRNFSRAAKVYDSVSCQVWLAGAYYCVANLCLCSLSKEGPVDVYRQGSSINV